MALEKIHRFLQETWVHFRKLDVPQKTAIFSVTAFIACSIFASTTLTFVLLGAGFVGFWTASSVVVQTQFFSSNYLLKCLPTLIDPLKPGGKAAEAKHAILAEQTNLSGSSGVAAVNNQAIQQQLSVNFNIQKLTGFILKDFVYSWYNTLSEDEHVSEEIEQQINQLLEEDLPTRLSKVNPITLLCIILELFQLHVHRYRRARTSLRRIARGRGKKVDSSSLIASYETFAILHTAVQSESTELGYLRRCMDLLQRVLLSTNIVQCSAAHHLLNEILSVNVLQSLIDLLSDPDTVNEIIVLILSDDDNAENVTSSSPEQSGATNKNVSKTLQNIEKPPKELESRPMCTNSSDKIDEPPSYTEAITTYGKQSKVQLEHIDTQKQPQHINLQTNVSQNSARNLDRESHHHATTFTSLGKAYQQETTSNKFEDKGHQSANTMDRKAPDGISSKVSHDEIVYKRGEVQNVKTGQSSSTGILTSAFNIAAFNLKDKLGIKENESGKNEVDLVTESKVHHKSSQMVRKGSGVRFSYLQRLGIQGVKHDQAEDKKELNPQEDDQNFSRQQTNNQPQYSPQHSPKKEHEIVPQQSAASTSSFSFPIPFTSLGPSIPISKHSPPKSPTKKEAEKKSSKVAVAEKVANLKFVPVPMTAVGPSIPLTSDTKAGDNQMDRKSSEGGMMSRSSSSSSFASITYEDDQQDIPFEELDYQFSSGTPDVKQTKQLTNYMKPKIPVVHVEKSNQEEYEEYIAIKPEEFPHKQSSETNIKHVKNTHKRLSWQGDYSSSFEELYDTSVHYDEKLGRSSDFNLKLEDPKAKLSSDETQWNLLPDVSSGVELARPTSLDTKGVTFEPISPAAPSKVRPTLTRSKTTPALLSIEGIGKQEVARSEVRLMEAKVGRFHISAVSIPRTETMKDRSGKEYILYCVQYQVTAQGVPSKSSETDINVSGVVTKVVKRRHREFVNLHCRLDENLKFKTLLKGIKDPPRRIGVGLAFGAVSKTVYEHRRISLEHYLQQLIHQPMLGHSEEIAEFLALGGDAHIEFVKKRTDIAPKIDQFFQWAVPSFVSTMKSAVPRAVVDLGTGAKMLSPPVSPKSHRKHKSFDMTAALLGTREGAFSPTPMDNLDMEWVNENSRLQKTKLTQVQSAAHLFLQDHHNRETEPKPDKIHKTYPAKPIDLGPRFEGDGCDATELATEGQDTKAPQVLPMEEIELLDKIMALLTEAMHGQGQPSWILDERLQKAVCVVVGKPLDRWIKDQIEGLVSEQWCAYFLTLIQDAIWPNGELIETTAIRTDEEKEGMRREALQCLIDVLPSYLQKVIGQEKWKACMEVMLDSLQDPQLNRHLVFTLLDLLLEVIATEITQHEFQESLLNSNTSLS